MSFGIPVRNGLGVGLLPSTSLATRNAFSPAVLFAAGEPGAWFDPSDITTLFQDTAGTTPVTAAGQSVARINDKSGRGNNATQTTAGSRPTYQIDSTGRPFLLFDGTDDFLVTPTITPGTNKVQVFTGVRKLANTTGILLETSANRAANSGAFTFLSPSSTAPSQGYGFISRGTADGIAEVTTGYAQPITNVVTGLGDISGDRSTLRVNGSQVAQATTDQGTGNYLAYAAYIGRRGGTTLPFSGRVYSLIMRFGANLSNTQISQTENWVNAKTGAY